MRKTLMAAALVLALCCSAYAGDISNPSVTQPSPPPGMTTEESAQTDGDIENGAVESLTDAVLAVLESVLSIF